MYQEQYKSEYLKNIIIKKILINITIVIVLLCLPFNTYAKDNGDGTYIVDVTNADLSIGIPKTFQYTLLDSSSKGKFYTLHKGYSRDETINLMKENNSYLFGLNKEESASVELRRVYAEGEYLTDFGLMNYDERQAVLISFGESIKNTQGCKILRQNILKFEPYIFLKYVIQTGDSYLIEYVTVVDGDYIIIAYAFENAGLLNENEKMTDTATLAIKVNNYNPIIDESNDNSVQKPRNTFFSRYSYGEINEIVVWVILVAFWTFGGVIASWIFIMPLCIIFTALPLIRYLNKSGAIDKTRADGYSLGWISICLIANISLGFLVYKFSPSYSWIGYILGYFIALLMGVKKLTPKTIENRIDFIRSYGRFCDTDRINDITVLIEDYPNGLINFGTFDEKELIVSKKEYGTGWMYFYLYFRIPLGILGIIESIFVDKPVGVFALTTWIELIFTTILFALCIKKRKYAYYAIWTSIAWESINAVFIFIKYDINSGIAIVLGVILGFTWLAVNGIYFSHRKYIFERYEARRMKSNQSSSTTRIGKQVNSIANINEEYEKKSMMTRDFTKSCEYPDEDYVIPRIDRDASKIVKDIVYYNAEFEKRFGGFVHPYTKKPIKTVQDYFDAIDSLDAKRSIITERQLSIEELTTIVRDKMHGVRVTGIDGYIETIDDFLKAIDSGSDN